MKLNKILKVLPSEIADKISSNWNRRGGLKRDDMLHLENILFTIQNELEHTKGKKKNQLITTLNDIRNVLLDELEINESRPGMRWPAVERMRARITG